MVAAFATATLVSFSRGSDATPAGLEEFLAMRLAVGNFIIVVGFALLWHLLLVFFRLYHSRRLEHSLLKEAADVLKVTTIGTLLLGGAAQLLDIVLITRDASFLVTFWVVSSVLTIACRWILRYALNQIRRHGRNLNHVLIIGTNARALAIAEELQSQQGLGYDIVGFVDDQWDGQPLAEGLPSVVADLAGFRDYIKHNVVDEVIICVPLKSLYDRASEISTACEEQGITVRLVSHVINPSRGKVRADHLGDHYVITIDDQDTKHRWLWLKRVMDFVFSLLVLFMISPVMLAIAIAIKMTSAGPILFKQERIGLNKRRFMLYKFRTMVTDAEQRLAEIEHLNEAQGPVFKIANDPRITPVGRFLRRTSLDELPQIFNVLKGDMSLVGPRPLPVRDYQGFEKDWHRRRLSVRPGITCLWQVEGRSSIPFEEWMELDMKYIDQWSVWLDLKILIRTIPVVLKGSGAY